MVLLDLTGAMVGGPAVLRLTTTKDGRVEYPSGQDTVSAEADAMSQGAAEIFASTEFQQDVVKGLYQQILHRAADTTGLNFYVAALQQGQTDQQIAATLAASAEFFQPL